MSRPGFRAWFILVLLGAVSIACRAEGSGAEEEEASTYIQLHHWQALTAIDNNDIEDAIHHVEHIVTLVEGDHRDVMLGTAVDLREGRFNEAEHQIVIMLSGYLGPSLSEGQVHIQMALHSLGSDDFDGAAHHVSHFMAGATGDRLADGEAAISKLMKGDRVRSEKLLRALVAKVVDVDLAGETCRTGVAESLPEHNIETLVLFDREWAGARQEQATEAAMAIVEEANSALHEIGYHLEVTEYIGWERPSGLRFEEVGPRAAQEFLASPGEKLVIVFTGGHPEGSIDGKFQRSSNTIVVKHDHSSSSHESTILVHEVGHAVGLAHRFGTYMQPHGFPLIPIWSGCQMSDA